MKTHIYYPGMEVRDELWLKFALLYLERLAFVFTVSEKSGLTALLETLRQQTDLLAEPPEPAFFAHITPQVESQIAGLVAPDFVRHKVFGNRELIARWRSAPNHDCFCPAQAGLERLHGFCLAHGFATQDEGGIRMARRFANLLSMRLAREWALANDGASSRITTIWTGCCTCLNPATTIAAVRIASTSRSRCKCPLTWPTSRLQSSLPCGGEAAFVSSSPSSIRPSMPCSPCWAAATPNPPC